MAIVQQKAGNSAVIRMEKVRSEMEHLRGKHWKKYWISFQNMFPTNFRPEDKFPILIKFIDAKENLSIQVHPSDETAKSELGEQGKAEMWYVLAAKPHAFLYYGLNREVSKEESWSRRCRTVRFRRF